MDLHPTHALAVQDEEALAEHVDFEHEEHAPSQEQVRELIARWRADGGAPEWAHWDHTQYHEWRNGKAPKSHVARQSIGSPLRQSLESY